MKLIYTCLNEIQDKQQQVFLTQQYFPLKKTKFMSLCKTVDSRSISQEFHNNKKGKTNPDSIHSLIHSFMLIYRLSANVNSANERNKTPVKITINLGEK